VAFSDVSHGAKYFIQRAGEVRSGDDLPQLSRLWCAPADSQKGTAACQHAWRSAALHAPSVPARNFGSVSKA